jgi:ribulose-5-phosphate 4-epimerase/fuculose-1-phosphate aldolase
MDRLKKLLADAGRVLAHEGQGDYVAGHISLRVPDAIHARATVEPQVGLLEVHPLGCSRADRML